MEKTNQPHAVCGAKTRKGELCKSRPMPNGKCRMHGGCSTGPIDQTGNQNAVGHGAPEDNQNARKHGLFSKCLNEFGKEVYQGAKKETVEDLQRDSAEFLLAQIAQAFETNGDIEKAQNEVEAAILALASEEVISYKYAQLLIRRIRQPDIATLGKAMAPLKGLLDRKSISEEEKGDDPINALTEAIRQSRMLAEGD